MATRSLVSSVKMCCAALLVAGSAAAQEATDRPPVPREAEEETPFRASVEYGLTTFTGTSAVPDEWHTVTAELSRKTRPLTLVARTNYAHRFGQDGYQVEADAYPRISRRFYGYLNAGYSSSGIFPELRYGAELFGSFGRGGEASLGARRLEFADDAVTIYTGSVGAYVRNYYVSARPYVTPRDDGTARSGTLLVRRYLADGDSHVTLSAGAGTAPTESPLEFELGRTQSYRAGLYGRLPLHRGHSLRWSAGYEREELTRGQTRNRLAAGLGAETRF